MADTNLFKDAAMLIKTASRITVFTGAGISVESGIPPFRGDDGLWSKYDPIFLDINFFYRNPEKSWQLNKEIFYDFFGQSNPNQAHFIIARLERKGLVNTVITQNIDNLHQKAGSKNVIEFHGTSRLLTCIICQQQIDFKKELLEDLPPLCPECNGLLKPDYVFFGEPIPEKASIESFREADLSDLFIIIGTTGEIQPASLIPYQAARNGAKILEINTQNSNYTNTITDIFLQGKATKVMMNLEKQLNELGMTK